ncbi:hypothetical protein TKK_0012949 [Trichogramma kaykai]
MSVSENIKVDIRWWMKKLPLAMKVFRCSGFDLTIFTDASDTGWGAKLDALETCDLWSKHQLSEDINFKELLAVKYALESLASNAHNCSILLRIDNCTDIAYVNKMGGGRFKKLNSLARQICAMGRIEKNFFQSFVHTFQTKS